MRVYMIEFMAILTLGIFFGMGVALGGGMMLILYTIIGSGIYIGIRWLKERNA